MIFGWTDYDIGDRVVTGSCGNHGIITGFHHGLALITTDNGARLIVPVFELKPESTEV